MTSVGRKPWHDGLTGVLGEAAEGIDERYHPAHGVRSAMNKVFPSHFSFLFGEIALYSFVVLVLSGTYLSLFFDPSMRESTYDGTFSNLRGIDMSQAFSSTIDISFEVRGGLFVRQLHHWAALVFVGAILVHMLRIFFTGAFRKPREGNWVIGVALLGLAVTEGFLGYSLPDDELSGSGLRIMSGLLQSIPIIGNWVQWLVFNGEFPGHVVIPRFYAAHILLVPGLIIGLIAVHLGFVWYQKHTHFPGQHRTESNVQGQRMVPVFSIHSMTLFLSVFGALSLLGGLAQINPVFNYGPYSPAHGTVGSQPDWYLGFVEGALRLWPRWDIPLGRYEIPGPFWPGIVLPLVITAAVLYYPFLERRLTGDTREHNLLQRPRDNAGRTAAGVMGVTFYLWLLFAGGDDVIAYILNVPIEELVWIGRIGVIVMPLLAYWLTFLTCRRLQAADRQVLRLGVTAGVIQRRPDGTYVRVGQPTVDTTTEEPAAARR